jgi:hypothetical protein
MYNGDERRHLDSGRRSSDRAFCAEHHIIQDERKDNRALVCGKIANLKEDHIREVKEVKETMAELEKNVQRKADIEVLHTKANIADLKGLMKFMSVMLGVCCLVIAGQALWLKSDISAINSSIQGVHRRITETVNDSITRDEKQAGKLSVIENDISKITWRLDHLEVPDKK